MKNLIAFTILGVILGLGYVFPNYLITWASNFSEKINTTPASGVSLEE
jgi:hypothetical protein